ncbi:MAG: DUF58 domain-containing protein [Clostridia bacterium]|nr:DUF58 domain-containing protein [Clostridia bacterium]MBQ7789406.1 DUF58 domain-containing protein [Clostridia bacterium]
MKRKILDGEFLDRLDAAALVLKTPMTGYFGGGRKARSYGNTVEFADFREYFPGDDIRRIDWNVYARFEKYFIKLFTDERQMHNQILIDCSASMACGKPEKAEAALRIAAAFGYLSVSAMDRVSYKMLEGNKARNLGFTVTNKDSFYRAAQAMEMTEFEGETDLEKSILNMEAPGYDDGLTIIISDFLTESNWKKAIDFLMYKRREILMIQILSPDELYPDFDGRIQMMDSEAPDFGDPRNMKVRITRKMVDAYQRALDEYEKELIDFCASRGVTFFTVSSDDPIEKVIFGKGYETEVIK